MKISGMVVFVVLFILLIAGTSVLGNYDSVTPEMAHSQAALAVGTGLTAGISTALNWMFKLALGGVCTGFGIAAFNESRKGYKLWKRQSQSGRWQGGPNAGWQKQPQGPKLRREDLMLLALSGKFGQSNLSTMPRMNARLSTDNDDDELDIQL